MVNPIDALIAERVAPVLKQQGFKRKGRVFTFENGDGGRVFVRFHPYRLSREGAEFFLEVDVQPRVWRDWVSRDGTDQQRGLWASRVGPNGGRRGGALDIWSVDLDDEAAGGALGNTVAVVMPRMLSLLQSDAMADSVRNDADRANSPIQAGRLWALAACLAAEGPSLELNDLLCEIEETADGGDRHKFASEFVIFIRNWVRSHFPEPGK